MLTKCRPNADQVFGTRSAVPSNKNWCTWVTSTLGVHLVYTCSTTVLHIICHHYPFFTVLYLTLFVPL
ncbi:MAG: hypothetical protein ACKPKO_60510 [Candidatus Fonsibacter sp.]